MRLDEVAHELYGLAPEEFTRARNARAKEARAAGDSGLAGEVQALRKPTTGAWLLNQLVRVHGDEVQQVLALGAQLRAAQGTVAADELRALDRQRRQLTHAVAQQARALGRDAGRRVSDQVSTEVEETLRSAMVDEDAGAALSGGLLTDTFSATGIEPVDLSAVVALGAPAPAAPARPSVASRGTAQGRGAAQEAHDREAHDQEAHDREAARRREVEDARAALAEAESALTQALEDAGRARTRAADATLARERVRADRDEARRRLEDLDRAASQAVAAEDAATGGQEAATVAASSAAEVVRRRKGHLDAVLGGAGGAGAGASGG